MKNLLFTILLLAGVGEERLWNEHSKPHLQPDAVITSTV
jgi:hypothetical protein